MMNFTRKSIEKEIKRIHSLIPRNLLTHVYEEKLAAPLVVKVIDEAIADPNFDPEKKANLQALKDNGHFHKKKVTENPKIASQIENFFNREMHKAVREGRLPDKKQLAVLQAKWKEEDGTKNTHR